MERTLLPYLAILVVLLYGIYNAMFRHPQAEKKPSSRTYLEHTRKHNRSHIEEELARIDTPAYTKQYIIDVINHGSSQLHFKPQEVMEEGFASREDAPKIACYVLSLAGEKCDTPYPKDAAMFYSSNCAGCHGEDGKGIHGTYPDLTRRPLLGVEKRKAFLRYLLKSK
jgi:hypothetical protein